MGQGPIGVSRALAIYASHQSYALLATEANNGDRAYGCELRAGRTAVDGVVEADWYWPVDKTYGRKNSQSIDLRVVNL